MIVLCGTVFLNYLARGMERGRTWAERSYTVDVEEWRCTAAATSSSGRPGIHNADPVNRLSTADAGVKLETAVGDTDACLLSDPWAAARAQMHDPGNGVPETSKISGGNPMGGARSGTQHSMALGTIEGLSSELVRASPPTNPISSLGSAAVAAQWPAAPKPPDTDPGVMGGCLWEEFQADKAPLPMARPVLAPVKRKRNEGGQAKRSRVRSQQQLDR